MQLAASVLSSRKCLAQRPFVSIKPAARAAVRPMTICPVAKLTKASEFRSLSTAEIDGQVEEGKKELFSLRIKFAKREEYKPSEYRKIRRKIAQLLTIKRERELAEGVTRREAVGAERRRKTEAGFGNI